jgi:hypothetical protein
VKYNLKNFSYYTGTLLYLTLLHHLFSCKPLQPKPLNRFARTMAQTTRFACKEVPFRCRVHRKLHFGVKAPRKPPIFELGYQISSQITNNFSTVRHRRKSSADSLNKIGVGESNGDVIFPLGRHLAVKTTFGPILNYMFLAKMICTVHNILHMLVFQVNVTLLN